MMVFLLQTAGEDGLAGTSATWPDILMFLIFISPCALPVLALAALCVATLVRQSRADRRYDAAKRGEDP